MSESALRVASAVYNQTCDILLTERVSAVWEIRVRV